MKKKKYVRAPVRIKNPDVLRSCQEKLAQSGVNLSKAGVVEMALLAMEKCIGSGGNVGFFSMGKLRKMLAERSFENAKKALTEILTELESGRLSADELKEGNYRIETDSEARTITVFVGDQGQAVGFLPLFPEEMQKGIHR